MTAVIIIIVVVVLAALAAGGYVLAQRRKSQQLQEKFGPEYDRVLEQSESKSEAESTLSQRAKRHESLDLRPLDPATREKFQEDWRQIQGSFVDEPGGAIEHADSLVNSIMRERGYPLDDFDQRAADISVEHPRVVENYREARRIHDAHRNGTADTEDLRGAVTAYRSLVEALLDDSADRGGSGGPGGAGRGDAGRRGDGDGRDGDRRDGDGRDGDRRDVGRGDGASRGAATEQGNEGSRQ